MNRSKAIPVFFVIILVFIISTINLIDYIGEDNIGSYEEKELTQICEEKHPKIIFYNRVPKAGSTSLLILLNRIFYRNQVTHISSKNFSDYMPEEDILREYVNSIMDSSGKTFVNRHIYWIDFREFGYEKMDYINVVRDPITRIISGFYFRKFGNVTPDFQEKVWAMPKVELTFNECIVDEECVSYHIKGSFNTQIKYFCGQDPICKSSDIESIYNLAVKHYNEEYLWVGVLELWDESFQLLEKIVPDFFTGLVHEKSITPKNGNVTPTNHDQPSEEAIEYLRSLDEIKYEQKFYSYVKQDFLYRYNTCILQ
eukprot:TRINITY_DN310_c3_g1_i1.p1 TRINITY_DN310_c3_g1~~TRINITY_DN310_c3_g1_i1.p1  ORF type:complete len:312 (+),score=64.30 TRINITY_DN310_c3_g1_i1:192-1127(+)